MASAWGRIMNGLTYGLAGFREGYFATDVAHVDEYEEQAARILRYAVYQALVSNDVYRRIHSWSTSMKHQLAMYKYTRSVYNPAYRLVTFYSSHLFGGILDRDAGPIGAVPIDAESDSLRAAIANVWKASSFGILKDVIALKGATDGDVFLRVRDDPVKEKVFIERIDPGTVTHIDLDAYSNIKGYIIEEMRQDPRTKWDTKVKYRLEVSRDGDFVVSKTFLNGQSYGWDGDPSESSVPYTFVPAVAIQHFSIGLDWGVSELHAAMPKIHEMNDIASQLADEIRRSVQPVWLLSGEEPETSQTVGGATADESGEAGSRPEPTREEVKIRYAAAETKVTLMAAKLDLSHGFALLEGLREEVERDYPETRIDLHASSGSSGRALRIARQDISSKVRQRRQPYDTGVVKILQQAIAIAGWRQYPGFEGFNLDSYDKGELDFSIADRPVFEADPLDDIEVSQAFWNAFKTATESGADPRGYLKREGLSDEEIQEVLPDDEADEEVLDRGFGSADGGSDDAAEGQVGQADGGALEAVLDA